ncbi:MAG: hypothetical protein ACP5N6_09495 [Anaerolineae bacterium]|uniref:hypothetical protein n=1 Tax=Thermogutta sp. TaxID=1962930 RepID=UPI00321F98E2
MKFLRDTLATSTAEWLIAAFLVVAVVGSVIYLVSRSAATQGNKTNAWINGIPDPH